LITPDIDVATALDAAIGTLTLGVNLFVGPRRDYRAVPVAVFVLSSGGIPSRPIKGGPDEKHPAVSIMVRGDNASTPSSFQQGQALARLVFAAVDRVPPTGYCESRAPSSQPFYLGTGPDGHHEWSIILNLTVDD